MSNSIRINLTKDDLLAEIKMQLSAPQNANKTFVLVEGIDDIALFEPLLNVNECFLFESYGGKEALSEIVSESFADKRVIGIRDRDYEGQSQCERMFYCDYCNAEMMMISNNTYFSSLMKKIVVSSMNYLQLRDEILESLKMVSFTRKQNDERKWGVTLNGISSSYLFSLSNPIDLDNLILHINSKSEIKINTEMMETIIDDACNNTNNLLLYTNGHDFCAILKCMIVKMCGQKCLLNRLAESDFRKILSLSYNYDYFKLTKLYELLKQYGNKESLRIVRA